MLYTIVQVVAGLFAFLSIGPCLNNGTARFDKVLGFLACFAFLALIVFIEEVCR